MHVSTEGVLQLMCCGELEFNAVHTTAEVHVMYDHDWLSHWDSGHLVWWSSLSIFGLLDTNCIHLWRKYPHVKPKTRHQLNDSVCTRK